MWGLVSVICTVLYICLNFISGCRFLQGLTIGLCGAIAAFACYLPGTDVGTSLCGVYFVVSVPDYICCGLILVALLPFSCQPGIAFTP